jgi:hypothetical protein
MKTLLAFFLLATLAEAGSITVGPWYEFGFDPNHQPTVAGCLPDDPTGVPCRAGIGSLNLDTPPWTFTASSPVTLSVTDAFLSGDSFSIFDFGALVGSTPVVPMGASCGLDPNVCFADPAFSHATFGLLPGPHSLTITVQPAQILGEGFLRVQAVPEPSYVGLLAAVLALCMKRACRG